MYVNGSTTSSNKETMKVLLVIAHPDDECMFFCPSIARLQEQGGEVHVLCLSSGKQGLSCCIPEGGMDDLFH